MTAHSPQTTTILNPIPMGMAVMHHCKASRRTKRNTWRRVAPKQRSKPKKLHALADITIQTTGNHHNTSSHYHQRKQKCHCVYLRHIGTRQLPEHTEQFFILGDLCIRYAVLLLNISNAGTNISEQREPNDILPVAA